MQYTHSEHSPPIRVNEKISHRTQIDGSTITTTTHKTPDSPMKNIRNISRSTILSHSLALYVQIIWVGRGVEEYATTAAPEAPEAPEAPVCECHV